jgi:hypothetical protein
MTAFLHAADVLARKLGETGRYDDGISGLSGRDQSPTGAALGDAE